MKQNKVPMRRCIGCMESKPKRELLRVVYGEDGLTLDPTGKANGRGAYICNDPACLALAKKKNAFSRNLNTPVTQEDILRLEQQFSELRDKER